MDAQIQRALSHPKRAEVFGYLVHEKDATGTSEQGLADVFGLGIRIVEYHLKVLHSAGLIAHVEGEAGGTERSVVAVAATGR